MTLTFFVSSSDNQNITQPTEKQFNNSCEHSDPNSVVGSANDSCFKWFLDTDIESFRETVKEDVCNWIKKASEEGNLIIFKLFLTLSANTFICLSIKHPKHMKTYFFY